MAHRILSFAAATCRVIVSGWKEDDSRLLLLGGILRATGSQGVLSAPAHYETTDKINTK